MKRILVCSDIHGEIFKLENVLEEANYSPKRDQLILLGDYIDRGPYSRQVIEKVIKLVEKGAIALMGNHEQMFIEALHDEDFQEIWFRNGGKQTVSSYENNKNLMMKHAYWMQTHLKMYHETEDYIFVHAGLTPYEDLEDQEEEVMLWSRDFDEIGLGKTVIHGHTPADEITFIHDRILIDTGACMGGKLTLLELPSLNVYED